MPPRAFIPPPIWFDMRRRLHAILRAQGWTGDLAIVNNFHREEFDRRGIELYEKDLAEQEARLGITK
jgi:hypothetical protein